MRTRPQSITSSIFQRRIFSGNPPITPHYRGWIIRLSGPATVAERAWLKAHGFAFSGGKWCKPDRNDYVCRDQRGTST